LPEWADDRRLTNVRRELKSRTFVVILTSLSSPEEEEEEEEVRSRRWWSARFGRAGEDTSNW
jgi:hypothetical protein